jgi:hypothetical protein
MEKNQNPENTYHANPVFSIAGATPGANEAAWKTAYPNPDSLVAEPRPAGHGPTFTEAGAVAGTSDTGWRTSMPDPSRDTLDEFGHVITKIEAARRAEVVAANPRVLHLTPARRPAA